MSDELVRTNRGRVWEAKATENIDGWGDQELDTLLLAAQEEMGKLPQAFLEYRAEGGELYRHYDELDDLGALLVQIEQEIDSMKGGDDE